MFEDSNESLPFRPSNYRVKSTFIVFKFKFFLLYELLQLHIMALHPRTLSNCNCGSEDTILVKWLHKPKSQLNWLRKSLGLSSWQNPGENPCYTVAGLGMHELFSTLKIIKGSLIHICTWGPLTLQAQVMFEEGIMTVLTIWDFTQTFDAYTKFLESVISTCLKILM